MGKEGLGYLLAGMVLCTAPMAQAQIVIDEADMADAGDTLRYWNGLLLQFDGGDTGPNHVWDFSDLGPLFEGADTLVTVGSTPFLYQFFFNNPILYPQHDADYAVKGLEFGFQQLQLTNVYDYFKVGGSGLRNVGFGATINGLPSSVRRIPVDYIHRFPLEFGNVDTSLSNWDIDIPLLFSFRQEQERRNEVDGWGTIYLPTDTLEVLRVRSEIERTDSIYIDQFNFGFSLPEPQTIEYRWLAQGRKFPVLQVNTIGGIPVLVRFQYDLENISTAVTANEVGGFSVFPNPASERVVVRAADLRGAELRLFDPLGRLLGSWTPLTDRTELDLSNVPDGVYMLAMERDGHRWTERLVVAR
ncbi:MAG: T9SS type A sorting domain-containing protein [Flavobacteriales bacterium]|nr:T9SS type A sorting domain-containing protein [Flavobacteriales bacterium]